MMILILERNAESIPIPLLLEILLYIELPENQMRNAGKEKDFFGSSTGSAINRNTLRLKFPAADHFYSESAENSLDRDGTAGLCPLHR